MESKLVEFDHDAPGPDRPHLQVLAGSNGCTIGSLSATTVGRDLHIQYIADPPCPPQPRIDSNATIQTQRETILKCLKAPTFQGIYASALEQRMAQTGSWFLELPDFQSFMGSKGITLWCTGMPGAGKTILASVAVEHLRKAIEGSTHNALAFAFIRYSECFTWQEILSSLLVQLVGQNDVACAAVWHFYLREATNTGPEIILPESELETALLNIAGKLDRLYIAIDGLDEAKDEVKDRLLEILAPSGSNLVILSRPLHLYTHHAPDALFVRIQAETKDIELYVRGEIQRSSRLRSIFERKPEKIAELCERITKQSDGMFLVAKLQMGVISRSSKSIASLFRNLEALPAGLSAMYDHTLSRIRDSEDSSIAFRTFAWVAYSNTNLMPDCLQHALSFDMDTKSFDPDDVTPIALILSACQGLVVLNDSGSHSDRLMVRFIHYSTHEYVTSVALDAIPNPHLLLAYTCLACMEDNHGHMLDFCRQSFPPSPDEYFAEYPLLRYSHSHWASHVRLSQLPDSVFPFILPYLSKHDWYPVYDLKSFSLYGGAAHIVSGAHLIARHDLTGGFDARSAQALLTHVQSEATGYTPFHFAAASGQFETFRLLLSSYRGANIRSKSDGTVLHLATSNDMTLFVQQLYHFTTATQEGTASGAPEVYKFDPNAQNSGGITPLMIACFQCNDTLVRLFSSCEGVDLNIQDNTGRSALHHLARACHGRDESLENLQQRDALFRVLCSLPGADINARDQQGDSPFSEACRGGLEETVRYLLVAGTNGRLAHQINNCGRTPLMAVCYAIGQGYADPHRESALMAIIDLLLAHGSDLHAQDAGGMTPFLYVLGDGKSGHMHVFASFILYSLSPRGVLPARLMERLLTLDSTLIDQRDSRGNTTLIIASRESYASSVKWLLEKRGADSDYVNAQDEDGMSALLYGCRRGSQEVVASLLTSPCLNIYHRCSRGLSAIDHLGKTDDWPEYCDIFSMLVRAGDWDAPLVRKATVRALLTAFCRGVFEMGAKDFQTLWSISSGYFIWDIENPDTVLLLAVTASRIPCKVPVTLVLHSLGLLRAQPPVQGQELFRVKDECFKHKRSQWSQCWDHDCLLVSRLKSHSVGVV